MQLGFSYYELTKAKKLPRREKLLDEIELVMVVLWHALIALIKAH